MMALSLGSRTSVLKESIEYDQFQLWLDRRYEGMRDERFDGRYWSALRLKAREEETYAGKAHVGEFDGRGCLWCSLQEFCWKCEILCKISSFLKFRILIWQNITWMYKKPNSRIVAAEHTALAEHSAPFNHSVSFDSTGGTVSN